MGRAKVKLEFIKNQRNRTKSFKSRTKILTKKAHELKTLCDVGVCMIIRGPSVEGRPMIVWPPNEDIRPLIESYNKQSNEDRKRRTTNLVDFLRNRNKKVEGDLAKLRKVNDDTKYATWDERYEKCSEAELREIAAMLENKIKEGKRRIAEVNGCDGAGAQNGLGSVPMGLVAGQYYSMESLLRTRNMQLEEIPIPGYYQHEEPANNNFLVNPMAMTLMGNNHYSQLTADHNSNSIYSSYNYPYYNDLMLENAVANLPQPPPWAYYTPNMLTVQPYLQYPAVNPPQSSATQMENYYDFNQIYMGDGKARP